MNKKTLGVLGALAALSLSAEASSAYTASQQLVQAACSGKNSYDYSGSAYGNPAYQAPVCDPTKLANTAISVQDLPPVFSAVTGKNSDNSKVVLPSNLAKIYSLSNEVLSNPDGYTSPQGGYGGVVGNNPISGTIFRKNGS